MRITGPMVIAAMLVSPVFVPALPAMAAPIDGLKYLVGNWKCTYRAGTIRLPYDATYVYDLGGKALRQMTSFGTGGGDEELLASDAQHGGWTATVLDDHGDATVMRGTGKDPKHIIYRSIYPDPSIVESFDQISATEYTIHATVRSGGKTTTSADTCLRIAP